MNHLIIDIVALLAVALIGFGVWQMHPPCAFITVGMLLLAVCVLAAKNPTVINNDT